MNSNVIYNYVRLRYTVFFLPLLFLVIIVLFLYNQNALNVSEYISLQKKSFYFINYHLGHYPKLQYNLTQFGDALVFLSFLSILILYAPKIWECLFSGLLVSLLLSCSLKNIFAVPRPAVMFNNNSFYIIGKAVCGHNSLPSGHSITVFTVLTVLLFGFMPRALKFKIPWISLILVIGLILAFTRVGAHYPIDVIVGSIIGYISGLLGIFISRKYKIWNWISNTNYYPFVIVLFVICSILLVTRLLTENLLVYYSAFISLAVSLYKIIQAYVKR